jgi:hypothetical protein
MCILFDHWPVMEDDIGLCQCPSFQMKREVTQENGAVNQPSSCVWCKNDFCVLNCVIERDLYTEPVKQSTKEPLAKQTYI